MTLSLTFTVSTNFVQWIVQHSCGEPKICAGFCPMRIFVGPPGDTKNECHFEAYCPKLSNKLGRVGETVPVLRHGTAAFMRQNERRGVDRSQLDLNIATPSRNRWSDDCGAKKQSGILLSFSRVPVVVLCVNKAHWFR